MSNKSIALLLVFTAIFCVRERESFVPPEIEDGRVDMSGWDFAERGPVKLAGFWQFWWNDLLEPGNTVALESNKNYVSVPAHWTDYSVDGKPVPKIGKATFRLQMKLPAGSRNLALRVPSMDSVFILFVNGVERARNANIMDETETTKPIYYAPIVLPLEASDKIDLVLHLANSIYPRPGFRDSIEIGTRTELEGSQDKEIWFDIFLFGALFIMALYHFGLYVLRPQDRSPVYFAVFCLAMGIRLLVTGEAFAYRILPITWQVSTFFEYITFYLAGPSIILFLSSLFPQERVRILDRILIVITLVFSSIVIIAPLPFYTQTLDPYHVFVLLCAVYALYMVIRATIHRRETARTFLFGAVILLLTAVNDVAYARRMIQSVFLVPVGVFIFFFSQAFLLSRRFASAFNTAEVLSRKMEEKVVERTTELAEARDRSDRLLLNILPAPVAEELKLKGRVKPVYIPSVTVLFTDFEGFTTAAEKMPPDILVEELDRCFRFFDGLMDKYGLEKLKTIGDSYMCAGGLPQQNMTHALDAILCALEMQSFMLTVQNQSTRIGGWNIRIGLHTGPVVAGVIGEKKFVYDIWGDTVNTASRIEETGQIGRVNVSETTYALVREYVDAEERGLIQVKGKNDIRMYFIKGIKPEHEAILRRQAAKQ